MCNKAEVKRKISELCNDIMGKLSNPKSTLLSFCLLHNKMRYFNKICIFFFLVEKIIFEKKKRNCGGKSGMLNKLQNKSVKKKNHK